MGQLIKIYVGAREFLRNVAKGQTMTEYALILAAIAIVVFVTYQVLGQTITNFTTWQVDNDLLSAAS
jgi:Flp pilus assembly pilin Flp